MSEMDLTPIFNRAPRVLVAEDDRLNRDLLVAYLTRAGCEVMAASDGQKALDLTRQLNPDLAVVDIMMPGMDGLELCRTLKREPETRSTPVLVVTALDSEAERLRAIENGADDFITKPYYSAILLTRVRSLLRIKKLRDEVESRNRVLRHVLDRYVADEVVESILSDPEQNLRLGGVARQITVLFADLRGFNRYAQEHSAEETIETLNRIFPSLSQVVFDQRGTFDKYLGDGLMAFFGAPLEREDDAQRAIQCAIEMQRLFSSLKEKERGELEGLGLGIGLHTGEAVVGNIGSERRMDYTAVGDVVNIANRLQELAAEGQILISGDTYTQAHGANASRFESADLVGRDPIIEVYQVFARDAQTTSGDSKGDQPGFNQM